MMRTSLVLAVLSAAAASQQPPASFFPWEQQVADIGAMSPAWYVHKPAGFAAPAGASSSLSPASPSPFAAARPSYPPNFPGYPTFGTAQPVGNPNQAPKSSGGIPYSFTTTYKPKMTTNSRPKPTGSKSNLDKYLPLMKKKGQKGTVTTTVPTTTTKRARKLPTKRATVPSKRPTTTTVAPTTTVVEESAEWESVEVTEKSSSTTTAPSTTIGTTETAKTAETKKGKTMVKGPIVPRGKPEMPSSTTSTAKPDEEEEAEFNLLGFLWDKSELLASIKNMIKQLKSSIDEAGLEEDVKHVSEHVKNTIKTFAAASPVNEQLGRLFERAQNTDVKLD